MNTIVIWALPASEKSDRLYEQPISSRCQNQDDVEKVIAAATKDGWHSFRVVKDDGNPPDFIGAIDWKRLGMKPPKRKR